MNAEEYLKGLNENDPVFEADTEYEFTEQQLINFAEAYHQAAFRLENFMCWTSVEDKLPDELETVWISNGKGWTTLGCRVSDENGWHWAESNGVIYQQDNKIISECESDDLDVRFWQRLPEPPLFGYLNKY